MSSGDRTVVSDKHLLLMKHNDQSDNLCVLVEAGVRSLKIQGCYKDMAYVKNITTYYHHLLDDILTERPDLVAQDSASDNTGSFATGKLHQF